MVREAQHSVAIFSVHSLIRQNGTNRSTTCPRSRHQQLVLLSTSYTESHVPVHSLPQLPEEDLVVLIRCLECLVYDGPVLLWRQVRDINLPQLATLLKIVMKPEKR
jgi:hypothetical protein